MIAYIYGKLEIINETSIILETNGIGYELVCANPLKFEGEVGQMIRVYTFHYIREDAQLLYGFSDPEEKMLFSRILQVSGIGPKGALAIVGTAGVNDFVVAIETEDEKFLTQFPGVGKKTARQMILDLKGKLATEFDVTAPDHQKETEMDTLVNMQALEEALEALRSLGYSDRELKQIVPKLKQEKSDKTDHYIRTGLALLTQK
ncbi:Holliday junction ATP-dependent DNA helicase RuvA [Paraliobacillus sp. PM-2]|uniref:Holliday junction branch migration protein RuvA n=1 Tax=Paraliobacillus sp. PM-2 TaxID=1462524 RepID=UPI00061BB05D|nr:Holliday junction branch migration protein RuvA [Paraliobacillus sp. PM-2]CQR46960.1 Holliday junction ATP-dependent DNA helicase RuvA [Paraliobacillus sp. PM-2]